MANSKSMDIELRKLHFDGQNPRHDDLNDEPEIINELYGKEHVLGLIKHIAVNGLSPLDRMAVIKHPKLAGHYIVVEGNRRLCALKLLNDPAKAPSTVSKKAVANAKETSKATIKALEVVVFPNKETASVWIKLRHEGEQDGAGLKKWDAAQIARNSANSDGFDNPNALALAFLDYAVAHELISKAQQKKIAITTITRYLSNPVVRHALGLNGARKLELLVPESEFKIVAKQFLDDALAGEESPLTSRTNSKQRADYAQDLIRKGVAPKTRLKQPIAALAVAQPTSTATSSATRHSKNPDHRPRVIPNEFKVPIKDRVLKRVFDELRDIDPENFSFATAYLLRAFIELTAMGYAQKNNLGHNGELNAVIGRCVKHLESQGLPEKYAKPLRVMASEKDARVSPHSLGAWVHGSAIPTGAELKRRWDTIEGGFAMMLKDLSQP
jgi:hypothetical protein